MGVMSFAAVRRSVRTACVCSFLEEGGLEPWAFFFFLSLRQEQEGSL